MPTNIRIYGYLRASTDEQEASRAKSDLIEFADKMGYPVAYWFEENESGARLHRPELFRLLDIAIAGDIILVEQVDRISRLNTKDWEQLKNIIASKGLRVVALDLPTSHQFMRTSDEFTDRMLAALNNMMLDMLAAVARKDVVAKHKAFKERSEKGNTKVAPLISSCTKKLKVYFVKGKATAKSKH